MQMAQAKPRLTATVMDGFRVQIRAWREVCSSSGWMSYEMMVLSPSL